MLGGAYLVAYMDRVNISFAALQMNAELGFNATVYGLAGGLFFLSYALFEVPSNVFLARLGARRWVARIMIVWGLLAAGTMFVRTPWQLYTMRFLLGMAEAGFLPGAIYYLAHWFPRSYRGRAISRFYMTVPLAHVVMGAVSGWLLRLDGHDGLHGWQWLFVAQGLPAVFIGLLVLRFLPDTPGTVDWLTVDEKAWLAGELANDAVGIIKPANYQISAVFRDSLVLRLGFFGFLLVGALVAFTLSAPLFLKGATQFDATRIGWITSAGGLLSVLGLLLGGWLSDRSGERFTMMLGSTAVVVVAFLTLAFATSPALVITAYLMLAVGGTSATLGSFMLWPDLLHRRTLAVGTAAINSLSQVGAFAMPYAWGAAKDATGSFRAGLLGAAAVTLIALAVALTVRRHHDLASNAAQLRG